MSDTTSAAQATPVAAVTLTTTAPAPASFGQPAQPATATATVVPVSPAVVPTPPVTWMGLFTALIGLPTARALSLMAMATCCYVTWQNSDRLGSAVVRYIDAAAVARQDRTERVHATALTDAVVRERQSRALLGQLMAANQSSRASLWTFHNGQESLQGVPFLKVSETAEVVAPGVSAEKDRHQGLALNTVIEWLPQMLKGECIAQDDDGASAPLRAAMRDAGAEQIYACPVFAGRREPAGYVALSFTRGWPPPQDREKALASLRAAATAQGAVISAYQESLNR